MASRMKVDVLEVIGNKKEFEYELDMKVKELDRSEIINISHSVTETNKGTRYMAVILHRYDDAWWK
mgnify:FL=1